ncbi:OsmC family protein [bacterium SCSIO 12643]|nr:OsmC family protein [bacterium SCSIO 12643]
MEIEIKFDQHGRIVPYMNGSEITMDVSPFLIFLATAGMCSAVFVQAFMNQRGMSTDGVKIIQRMNYDYATNKVKDIDIHVDLPESFPEKYNTAIKRVVDQCPVKQHLLAPPTFNVITNIDKKVAVN